MADEFAGTALGAGVHDVLAGRLVIRDLGEDPEFTASTRAGMHAYEKAWDALTPDQRAEQLKAGRAYESDRAKRLDERDH